MLGPEGGLGSTRANRGAEPWQTMSLGLLSDWSAWPSQLQSQGTALTTVVLH